MDEQDKISFRGDIDFETIKKVKEAVSIPVIGNGNITSGKTAQEMFDKTNCDGIMIARSAQGNPWIFEEILSYFEGKEDIKKPELKDVKEMMLRHLTMLKDYKNEKIAVLEMRKNIAWYIKGLPNSSSLRNEINKIEEFQELVNKINEI